jgi:hypothetical protein
MNLIFQMTTTDFVAQFAYWQGSHASQLDTESLMILLWQMHKRIKKMETNHD